MFATLDHTIIKLVDFGFATDFSDNDGKLMKAPCGTMRYAAPEVLYQMLAATKDGLENKDLYEEMYSSHLNVHGYDQRCDVSCESIQSLIP